MEFTSNLMGQQTLSSTFAQNLVYKSSAPVNESTQPLILTPTQFTNKMGWVLQTEKEMVPEKKTMVVWELKDLDLTYNSRATVGKSAHKCPNVFINSTQISVVKPVQINNVEKVNSFAVKVRDRSWNRGKIMWGKWTSLA